VTPPVGMVTLPIFVEDGDELYVILANNKYSDAKDDIAPRYRLLVSSLSAASNVACATCGCNITILYFCELLLDATGIAI